MGKLGKETKTLLIAITAVCLISFLLAGGELPHFWQKIFSRNYCSMIMVLQAIC